jgi:hypothetical protein
MYYPVVGYDDDNGYPCSPLLLSYFENDNPADISGWNMAFQLRDNFIQDEALWFANNPQLNSFYSGGDINNHVADNWTWQFYLYFTGGIPGAASRGLSSVAGFSADNRIFLESNTTGFFSRQISYRNGIIFQEVFSGEQVPLNTWMHFAIVMDRTQNELSMYFAGVRVIHDTGNNQGNLPVNNGVVTWGGSNTPGDGTIKVTDISIYPCILYTGDSFTPPQRHGGD